MKKRIFKIASIASVFACVAVALFAGLSIKNNQSAGDELQEPQEGLIVDTELGKNPESAIRLLANSSTAESGVTQVTVTATVGPDYVLNKNLSWKLEWASTNSAKVSDYVSYQVSADTLIEGLQLIMIN